MRMEKVKYYSPLHEQKLLQSVLGRVSYQAARCWENQRKQSRIVYSKY